MSTPHDSSDQAGSPRPPVDAPVGGSLPPPPGYGSPPYPPPPKRGGIFTRILASVVSSLLVVSLLFNVYFVAILFAYQSGPRETEYSSGSKADRIVIIPIKGLIDEDAHTFVRVAFRKLRKNPPKAVVLRIDSGGGLVGASDRIWSEIVRFKEDFKKENKPIPVVASFGSVAASGGYYVAAPADVIVAEQTTITGSIGVIAQAFTFRGLMDKVGVTPETIVATNATDKDMLNPLRDWTDDDRQKLRHILDEAHRRFVEVVFKGRSAAAGLTEEEVRKLATGQVFTANQAKENKLVDELGYLDRAIEIAKSEAGISEDVHPKVMIMDRPAGLLGLLGASRSAPGVDLTTISPEQIRAWLLELGVPRPAYSVDW